MASMVSASAAMPARLRTMYQCHHSLRNCAQFDAGARVLQVMTTALIGWLAKRVTKAATIMRTAAAMSR